MKEIYIVDVGQSYGNTEKDSKVNNSRITCNLSFEISFSCTKRHFLFPNIA